MTRDDFWRIVDAVNWGELTRLPRNTSKGRGLPAYQLGKVRLLEALPTAEDSEAFWAHFDSVYGQLAQFFDSWEAVDPSVRSPGLGDDGFNDLVAHVIGLGAAECESVFMDPARLQERGLRGDFEESFAYCLPDMSDYEPVRIKLARSTDALGYWKDRAESDLLIGRTVHWAQEEVRMRTETCERLRDVLRAEGGTEMTSEEYLAFLQPPELKTVRVKVTETVRRTILVDVDVPTGSTTEESFAEARAAAHKKDEFEWAEFVDGEGTYCEIM